MASAAGTNILKLRGWCYPDRHAERRARPLAALTESRAP